MKLKIISENGGKIEYLWFHAAGGFYKVGGTTALCQIKENETIIEWTDLYIKVGNKKIDLNPDFFDLDESRGITCIYSENTDSQENKIKRVFIDDEEIPVTIKMYTVIQEYTPGRDNCTIRPFEKKDLLFDGSQKSTYNYSVEIDCYADLELAIKSSCFRPDVINFQQFSKEQELEKDAIIKRLTQDREYMQLWA